VSSFLEKYKRYGIKPHGILFFTPDIAIEIIEEAEIEKVVVLGIDGFTVRLKSTQPSMEHSIDLSKVDVSNKWNVAREFLKEKRTLGMLFEIILDD